MSETIYLGPDEFRASAGKFRTTNRYLRADAGGTLTVVPQGKTMDVFASGKGSLTWRYSVNGYILEHTEAGASSFTATVEPVKI